MSERPMPAGFTGAVHTNCTCPLCCPDKTRFAIDPAVIPFMGGPYGEVTITTLDPMAIVKAARIAELKEHVCKMALAERAAWHEWNAGRVKNIDAEQLALVDAVDALAAELAK